MSTNPKYFKRTNNTPRKFGQIDFTRTTYVNDKLKLYFRFPFWPKDPFQKSAFISSIKCEPCIEINKQKHKSIEKDFPCILSTDPQFIACAFCLISDRTSQCLTKRQRERAFIEYMSQSEVDNSQVDEIKAPVEKSKEREEGECKKEEEKKEEVEAEMKSCHPKVSNKRKRQADSIDKSEKKA